MKRIIIALIVCCCLHRTLAELPRSLEQVLFGISGGTDYTDYVQWLGVDGTMAFQRPFAVFNMAQFCMHYPTNDYAPRHYSVEMEREFHGESCSSNLVSLMQKAENILQKSFMGRDFERQYDGVNYRSSCANIDGRGWDVCFSVMPQADADKISYVAKARFYNRLHREGKFVSCEDFADAVKTSSYAPNCYLNAGNIAFSQTNDVAGTAGQFPALERAKEGAPGK